MIRRGDKPTNDLERLNPHRKLNWRQLRAQELLNAPGEPKKPERQDDRYIRKYLRFLYEFSRTAPDDGVTLFAKFPEMLFAHQVYDGDPWICAIIEARILAGQDDEAIAKNFGTLAGSICLYEKVFFNVRDRLGMRDFVVSVVLRAHQAGSVVRACSRDFGRQPGRLAPRSERNSFSFSSGKDVTDAGTPASAPTHHSLDRR